MWLWLAATGCGGGQDDVLAELDGRWLGEVTAIGGPYALDATFVWDEDAALLSGLVMVQEAAGPNTFAVRRSEVVGDEIDLEATDVLDGTRGLDLTGLVDGEFTGDAKLAYPCPQGTCGFEGSFRLASAPPLGTTPTTPPPTTPTPTPTTPTGATGDTGAATP